MMYAFLKHFYGEADPTLIATMNGIEYAPHTDPDWDPFSIVHNVRTARYLLEVSQANGSRCLDTRMVVWKVA
jgi:hypothetical protein